MTKKQKAQKRKRATLRKMREELYRLKKAQNERWWCEATGRVTNV